MKLTKSQNNEIKVQEYQARKDAIKQFGYSIESVRFAGEYEYYIHKDGKCIHPGASYEHHVSALIEVERLIAIPRSIAISIHEIKLEK